MDRCMEEKRTLATPKSMKVIPWNPVGSLSSACGPVLFQYMGPCIRSNQAADMRKK